MFRALVRTGIAVGFAIFAARQLVYGGRDLARYNKMRAMSDDPPLGVRTGNPETNAEARTSEPVRDAGEPPERLDALSQAEIDVREGTSASCA